MKALSAGDRRALLFVASGYGAAILAFLVMGSREYRSLPFSDVAWGVLVCPLQHWWYMGLLLILVAAGLARPRSLLVAFGALALCAYLLMGYLMCSLMVT